MNVPPERMLMIGATTTDAVKIWVKGKPADQEAQLVLHRQNSGETARATLDLYEADGWTSVYTFTGLEADTEYWCEAYLGDEELDTDVFRTFPAADTGPFKFMISSCNLVMPGRRKQVERSKKAFEGLNRIADEEGACFMIHAGDQIYIDAMAKPGPGVNSVEAYRERYNLSWGHEAAQSFFRKLPHFMVLDDHELINNFDNDLERPLSRPLRDYKMFGLKAYNEFQHAHNPDTPNAEYYYTFDYGNVSFFVMDTRTERYSSRGEMISETQLHAFIDWLDRNHGKKKFLVTGVPFLAKTTAIGGGDPSDKWYGDVFGRQRAEILRLLFRRNITDLVVLSGDIHAANRTFVSLDNAVHNCRIWEFISGPLNQDIENGDLIIDNIDTISPVPGAEYRYKSRTYTHLNPGAALQDELKQANVLVVTVDGDFLTFDWRPVQRDAPSIRRLRVDLRSGVEVDLVPAATAGQ